MSRRVAMDAASVTARLRQAAACSDLSVARAMEGKVSLAPAAVSARLRTVAQLRRLGLALRRSRPRTRSG